MKAKTIQMYKGGYPFDILLAKNLSNIKTHVQKDHAAMILVDGFVGSGKTTVAVHVADFIEGAPIAFDEQLAFGAQEFQQKLEICKKKGHKVLIYDEAGDYDKVNFQSVINKALNSIFDTVRAYKIVIIMVLPCMSRLPDTLFDKGIIQMLIHMTAREDLYSSFSVYSMLKIGYIRSDMKKYPIALLAYKTQTPNFRGHCKDLSTERRNLLKDYSLAGKDKIHGEARVKTNNYVSSAEIASKLGFTTSHVNQILKKEMVAPVERIGNAKYYNSDAFAIVKARVKSPIIKINGAQDA